jgi:hypothetical protein
LSHAEFTPMENRKTDRRITVARIDVEFLAYSFTKPMEFTIADPEISRNVVRTPLLGHESKNIPFKLRKRFEPGLRDIPETIAGVAGAEQRTDKTSARQHRAYCTDDMRGVVVGKEYCVSKILERFAETLSPARRKQKDDGRRKAKFTNPLSHFPAAQYREHILDQHNIRLHRSNQPQRSFAIYTVSGNVQIGLALEPLLYCAAKQELLYCKKNAFPFRIHVVLT